MAASVSDQVKNRQRMVIEYWYRTSQNDPAISILDIITIILEYADTFEILKFSEDWMAYNAFIFKHAKTMAIKKTDGNKWVLPDTEPITKGKTCWRINVS